MLGAFFEPEFHRNLLRRTKITHDLQSLLQRYLSGASSRYNQRALRGPLAPLVFEAHGSFRPRDEETVTFGLNEQSITGELQQNKSRVTEMLVSSTQLIGISLSVLESD